MGVSNVIRSSEGSFCFAIKSATPALLAEILTPAVPYVWLADYMPHPRMEWWTMPAVLRSGGIPIEAKVRLPMFDLLIGTRDFLKMLPELADSRLTLMQMHQPVPDTLCLQRIPDENRAAVLKDNGWHLSCHSPHRGEVALVSAPKRETLEHLLLGAEVQNAVLGF